MKSKKNYLLVSALIIVVVLVACSKNNGDFPKFLTKEGIQPYNLSESEKDLLRSFGIEEENSQIIYFNAPKEAIAMDINVYKLGDDKKWEMIGGGGISIGKEREPIEQLAGTLAMQLRENHVIYFNINCGGRASFKTDEIILDTETMMSMKGFLQEFQRIEMDKEIPVAFMVYDSGTIMRSYSLQDYFEPSKFEGMDLVQVVTLTFRGE